MKNSHTPVMINEILSHIPLNKPINVIDATFGGGGYSKAILDNFKVNYLLAIDRDPISDLFSKEIKAEYSNFSIVLVNWKRCFQRQNKNYLVLLRYQIYYLIG